MKRIPKSILTVCAFVTSACGGNEAETLKGSENTQTVKTVKAEKFKGSKFAPSQEVMNATIANEWFDRRGYSLAKLMNKSVCKGIVKYQPEKWPAACASVMNDWKARTAFTPSECRKGDERDGYDGVLVNPVSCTGLLEDPKGQEKRIFVFHKPQGEWKAWIGPSFPGTRKDR